NDSHPRLVKCTNRKRGFEKRDGMDREPSYNLTVADFILPKSSDWNILVIRNLLPQYEDSQGRIYIREHVPPTNFYN
ncbi:hypothetical protein HID58_034250, partial [Brassica napus]